MDGEERGRATDVQACMRRQSSSFRRCLSCARDRAWRCVCVRERAEFNLSRRGLNCAFSLVLGLISSDLLARGRDRAFGFWISTQSHPHRISIGGWWGEMHSSNAQCPFPHLSLHSPFSPLSVHADLVFPCTCSSMCVYTCPTFPVSLSALPLFPYFTHLRSHLQRKK